MSRGQKIITVALWAVLVVVMVGVIGAGAWDRLRARNETSTSLFDVPKFSLTDQDGNTVTDQSLHGHPWVAEFIFTRCPDVCLVMSDKMSKLQKMLKHQDIKLVSFSVDPTYDTPAVLKAYGHRFGADDSRWKFLTGPADVMKDVVSGMKSFAAPTTSNTNPMQHSTYMFLVDGQGHVRRIYHNEDPDDLARLATDADQLAGEKSP